MGQQDPFPHCSIGPFGGELCALSRLAMPADYNFLEVTNGTGFRFRTRLLAVRGFGVAVAARSKCRPKDMGHLFRNYRHHEQRACGERSPAVHKRVTSDRVAVVDLDGFCVLQPMLRGEGVSNPHLDNAYSRGSRQHR